MDGESGSPIIALERLLQHKAVARILRPGTKSLFRFIEEREDRCQRLQQEVDRLGCQPNVSVEIMHGTFEEHFPAVLALLNRVATPRTPALVW